MTVPYENEVLSENAEKKDEQKLDITGDADMTDVSDLLPDVQDLIVMLRKMLPDIKQGIQGNAFFPGRRAVQYNNIHSVFLFQGYSFRLSACDGT